jgi:hypothetical protein
MHAHGSDAARTVAGTVRLVIVSPNPGNHKEKNNKSSSVLYVLWKNFYGRRKRGFEEKKDRRKRAGLQFVHRTSLSLVLTEMETKKKKTMRK